MHPRTISQINPTTCTILFNIFIYFSSLHVSGIQVPIIRRKLLYFCNIGICHSVWVASGRLQPTGRPGLWARTACSFRSAQAATMLEFMYHSRIVLSVGGSVCYMIRNLRCTVTIDSVLANSKTQNAFLFTVNAIFLHFYPLAVEPGSTPRPLVQKELGELLYLLICSFLPCLSWLLRCRVRKSRRDLWITSLYYSACKKPRIKYTTKYVVKKLCSTF